MTRALALVVLLACAGAPAAALDCVYAAAEPAAELAPRGDCGRISAGGIELSPRHLAALHFDAEGLGRVYAASRVFYVLASGRSAEVLLVDNGPDDFRDGLARGVAGGKVGFVDRSLAFRIPARWDHALPFERGHAVVCDGCVELEVEGGEHRVREGGRWGLIDRAGRIVVPVEHTKEGLAASAAYRALVEPATRPR